MRNFFGHEIFINLVTWLTLLMKIRKVKNSHNFVMTNGAKFRPTECLQEGNSASSLDRELKNSFSYHRKTQPLSKSFLKICHFSILF